MNNKRLYISADIEGVAGVTSTEHLMPKGFEYEAARQWMTNEVLAACEVALEAGIDEIIVSDSHGNAQNLLIDQFPDQVRVIRGWPRPFGMMEGIQNSDFVGAMLIGYHPGATDLRGVLAHTMSGEIKEVRLNGQVASETLISAATAGAYGVPVILATGDDAYAEHIAETLGDIETVTTKWAISTTATDTKSPKAVCAEIREATKRALARAESTEPYIISLPITLDVRCGRRAIAEILEYMPGIERVDAYTIRGAFDDMQAVSQFIMFLTMSRVMESR